MTPWHVAKRSVSVLSHETGLVSKREWTYRGILMKEASRHIMHHADVSQCCTHEANDGFRPQSKWLSESSHLRVHVANL